MNNARRAPRRSGGGLPAGVNPFPASRSLFSRCKIWRSKRASAAPNTALSSPPLIQPPSPDSSRNWLSGCDSSRGFRTSASDLESQGLAAVLTVDRDTAARFGITLATIDNALYSAFGQRIISTIFTQSNQRRVDSRNGSFVHAVGETRCCSSIYPPRRRPAARFPCQRSRELRSSRRRF